MADQTNPEESLDPATGEGGEKACPATGEQAATATRVQAVARDGAETVAVVPAQALRVYRWWQQPCG